MPDQPPPLDIAGLDNWFGFRPGMSRAEVIEGLQKLGIEEDEAGDEHVATTVNDHDMEFHFATDGSQRLRQLSTDSEEVLWHGKPLIDTRLDGALRAIEPFGRTPMWEANDANFEPFPEPDELPAGPVSDEELLEEGTVWLPDRGLGLVICEGEVTAIVWREPRDVPARFAGPVTDAQRQLSKRPDLENYLREKSMARNRATAPKNPTGPLGTVLAWICIAALVVIARKGFREMQLWHTAPTVEGQFISMQEAPRKKYLDLAPEALRKHLPDDPTRHREMYHIEYLDPTGRPHTASLEAAEFYVPPREAGEKVPIAYVAGDPPRVKGLSRARDAAFLEYMPWAMAVGVFYVVAQFVLSFVSFILSALKGLAARKTTVDSDRPELR